MMGVENGEVWVLESFLFWEEYKMESWDLMFVGGGIGKYFVMVLLICFSCNPFLAFAKLQKTHGKENV